MRVLQQDDILKALIKQAAAEGIKTEEELHQLKKKWAKEHKMDLPKNWNLQNTLVALEKEGWKPERTLERLLRKRKIRTTSGVSVITVLTKPYPCPGQCVFCPTEPGMPKSYLSNEPGAMRAVLDDFHPKDQVQTRIKSLKNQGHETDKIEMIVLGGTFSAYEHRYQSNFVRALYNACNDKPGKSLEEAQAINETAPHRVIGLNLETRPDHVSPKEIKNFRKLGATKIQMGVQHTDNAILALNKRGETIEDSMHAIQMLKDAAFKIAIHLMPNLPGSTPEKDLKMLREVFENPMLRPDQIKIYPCVVTPYAELEQWWKEGRYESYSDEVLMNLLIEMQKTLPEYVRVERLFRDIPGESILEGSQKTNMRQLLEIKMKEMGVFCRCIRCREIREDVINPKALELKVQEFDASEGKEFFLSVDETEKDRLVALLRLRFSSYSMKGTPHFIKALEGAALVRELHTYGAQVEVGEKGEEGASQHLGLGKKLLLKAEEISHQAGFSKIAIIAGAGVRDYYRKQGYELIDTYMIKAL